VLERHGRKVAARPTSGQQTRPCTNTYLIESSAGRFNTAGVFAAVAVLVLLSVAITEALSRTERWGLRWRDK